MDDIPDDAPFRITTPERALRTLRRAAVWRYIEEARSALVGARIEDVRYEVVGGKAYPVLMVSTVGGRYHLIVQADDHAQEPGVLQIIAESANGSAPPKTVRLVRTGIRHDPTTCPTP
jgi:hypothetical protein